MIFARFFCVFCCLVPTWLRAELDSRTIFSKGAWAVEVTYDTEDNNFWCAASSTNRQDQTFSVVTYDNNTMSIFFFDDRWNLAPRKVDFLIDVDDERWTVTGDADGFGLSAVLDDGESAGDFVDNLMWGNAVALLNTDQRNLATFSLNGSAAAMGQLIECWDRIATPSDPFQTSQDPFR